MLKLINQTEEKMIELYEIICGTLSITDPELLGQAKVCEKFTKKALVDRTNKMLNLPLIVSLKELATSEDLKGNMGFWRNNILLEVLRMNKETVNVRLLLENENENNRKSLGQIIVKSI